MAAEWTVVRPTFLPGCTPIFELVQPLPVDPRLPLLDADGSICIFFKDSFRRQPLSVDCCNTIVNCDHSRKHYAISFLQAYGCCVQFSRRWTAMACRAFASYTSLLEVSLRPS
ncbi:hypothetical protein IF2G_02130 [Cordyceps javanica]|nr:hypothetical protein IF2G_02130 [Cordyceps javanica]